MENIFHGLATTLPPEKKNPPFLERNPTQGKSSIKIKQNTVASGKHVPEAVFLFNRSENCFQNYWTDRCQSENLKKLLKKKNCKFLEHFVELQNQSVRQLTQGQVRENVYEFQWGTGRSNGRRNESIQEACHCPAASLLISSE